MVIMIGKRTKTIGVSQLRCLTPKYSCKQQCGAHANGAINGIIDTSNGFQDICKSSHRNPRRLSPDSNRRPSGSQAKSLRTELLSGVSSNGDFCIKREMSKNAILLIIAPPRHQMTPDFFPALGKEPRSMPSNFISINQSVLDINQDGGKSILTQNDVIGCVELGLAQGFQWCLVCQNRMNGSKVINMNACPTLTYWWR